MNNYFPKVTFGIIVLNGEPFTRYCLRSLYPFAHQIIVVEGASRHAADMATLNGHSIDGTLNVLQEFKATEDPDNKLTLLTAEDLGFRDGFWPGEKDQQSQAYTQYATGDYLWQIDIDEFYHAADMTRLLKMLASDSTISGISFYWKNFWGGFDYLVDGWAYRDIVNRIGGNRRVFRWKKDFSYVSHRPPTVVDTAGRDLCRLNWIRPEQTAQMNIFCYHYGLVFPKQAKAKAAYYQKMSHRFKDLDHWYARSYQHLTRPFSVLHGTSPPSWLVRFSGVHPIEIQKLIVDIKKKRVAEPLRTTLDIEALLRSRWYPLAVTLLECFYTRFPITIKLGRFINRSVKRFVSRCLCVIKSSAGFFRKLAKPALEALPDSPDLFRVYRGLCRHPELTRKRGGWEYQNKFYPDYLTVGGASYSIFPVALSYCKGEGIDVGAGYWPLPGAMPVDLNRGAGAGKTVQDIPQASLDYVFSSHCLEHIDDWKEALSQWVEKVKPGGILFLYLPHPDCAIWHPGSPLVGNGHKWIPTPEGVASALQAIGQEVVDRGDGPDGMYSFYVCSKKV